MSLYILLFLLKFLLKIKDCDIKPRRTTLNWLISLCVPATHNRAVVRLTIVYIRTLTKHIKAIVRLTNYITHMSIVHIRILTNHIRASVILGNPMLLQ